MTVSYNMERLVDIIRGSIPHDSFSDTELMTLLAGTRDRRYGLIKRAIAQGDLLRLRRGLYCLGERHRRHPLNLFVLARKIYGPSYISGESALAHHGWIPEAVYTITSASVKRSREFHTPLGLFHYARIPAIPFLTGVDRIHSTDESYFLASPWRAVADYVWIHRKEWRGLKPLVEALRIDEALLHHTTAAELTALEAAFHRRRVSRFLAGVRKERHQ